MPAIDQATTVAPVWRRLASFDSRTVDAAGMVALMTVAVVMITFYIFFSYRSLMHSDSAMKLLLGQEMARHFTLFPRDWNYVNDIWIIFPSLLAAPFHLFVEPSMAVHAWVDAIATAMMLTASWFAARAVGIRGPLRLLPVLLLASGLSGEFAEMAFGQSAYSAVLLTLLLVAGSSARIMSAVDKATVRDRLVVAFLICVSVASGPRGVASYAGPLLIGVMAAYFASGNEPAERKQSRILLIDVIVATVVGGFFFLFLSRILLYHTGALSTGFATREAVIEHLQLLSSNWLRLFDALPPYGAPFKASIAAISATRLAIAGLIFFLPIALLSHVTRLSASMRFLVLFHIAITGSTLYLLVFSGVFVDPSGAPRYLIPLLPTGFLILTLWLQSLGDALRFNPTRVGWLFAAAMLVLSPGQLIGSGMNAWPNLRSGLRANAHDPLLKTLSDAGLTRGFAQYWDASVLWVLSGSRIRVAPVYIPPAGVPMPFHHLTSEAWYAPEWAEGPTFLIVGERERSVLNLPALAETLGQPARTLRAGSTDILVYPFNIGERLGFAPQPYVQLPRMTSATCAADITADPLVSPLRASMFGALKVHAVNRSALTWSQNSRPSFNPGLRITDTGGRTVFETRGTLPRVTQPGEKVDLSIGFRAPSSPGEYTIYFSFVAEGDAWCGDLHGGSVRIPLLVGS